MEPGVLDKAASRIAVVIRCLFVVVDIFPFFPYYNKSRSTVSFSRFDFRRFQYPTSITATVIAGHLSYQVFLNSNAFYIEFDIDLKIEFQIVHTVVVVRIQTC